MNSPTATAAGTSASDSKTSIPKEGRVGYVALLDVLGFRGLITGNADGAWVAEYLSAIDGGLWVSMAEAVVFSDSIVLTVEGIGPDSLHQICQSCSMLMFELLQQKGIPIRGAIAHGRFYRSQFGKSIFIAGQPIVEAYDVERKQDWVGIMLSPSAIRAASGFDLNALSLGDLDFDLAHANMSEYLNWRSIVQRYDEIPVHSENGRETMDGYAIVPSGLVARFGQIAENLRGLMLRLDELKLNAATPAGRRKYVSTSKWLRQIVSQCEISQRSYEDYKRQLAART